MATKHVAPAASVGCVQAEVRFLGDLKHPNLVNLYGFCCDGEDWMLVYEYVPNRSVDYHLFPCEDPGRAQPWRTYP